MSRYDNLPTYTYNGKRIFQSFPAIPPTFFSKFLSTKIRITENDTLDKLAFEFYDGQGDLWWVIAIANGLELPTDLMPNMILNIPLDYKSVLQAISTINSSQK